MSFNNLPINNTLLGSSYSSLPAGLQQTGSASSTGWGTGTSLLQMSSPYTSSSMVNGLSTNANSTPYYGSDSLGTNEMGSLLVILREVVTMVATLLLNQVLNNASASASNNSTPSSADSGQGSTDPASTPAPPAATPTPASPAPVPPPVATPSPASPAPATPTPAPAPAATPAPPCPAPAPPATNTNVKTDSVNGGGPNELVLKNTDSKPMTIALFENTGSGMNPNIDDPNHKYTVQPGQTLKLSMPASWQGRAQKLSGNADDPATWAEINYEPGQNAAPNKIWYDESTIRGYNSAVTMKPTNSADAGGGSDQSIIDGAPSDAVTTDAGGNKVIKATEGYDGSVNQSAQNYLDSSIGNTNAYVRHNDDGAVRTTQDTSLTVTVGAA